MHVHQSFRRKQLDRAAHRRQTHAQLARKLFDIQAHPGGKPTAENRFPDGRVYIVERTAALDLSQCAVLTIHVV